MAYLYLVESYIDAGKGESGEINISLDSNVTFYSKKYTTLHFTSIDTSTTAVMFLMNESRWVYNSIVSLINKGRGGQSLISFDSKGVATDSNVNIGGYDTSKKVFRHIYINNGQVTLGPTITASPNNPSGGSPGDIWLKYTE